MHSFFIDSTAAAPQNPTRQQEKTDRKMKKILTIACAAALAASCATGKQAAGIDALQGEWQVNQIENQAVRPAEGQQSPFIGFDPKQKLIYGTTGCNRLTGALNADGAKGTIDFSALGMTRMMCPDMTLEEKMTAVLAKVKTYKIDRKGQQLQLCDATGRTLLTLNKR